MCPARFLKTTRGGASGHVGGETCFGGECVRETVQFRVHPAAGKGGDGGRFQDPAVAGFVRLENVKVFAGVRLCPDTRHDGAEREEDAATVAEDPTIPLDSLYDRPGLDERHVKALETVVGRHVVNTDERALVLHDLGVGVFSVGEGIRQFFPAAGAGFPDKP